MNALKKLGDRAWVLTDHALFRWIVLLLFAVMVIGTAAYSYRKVDSDLTAVTLLRRETIAQLTAITLAEKFGRNLDIAISLSARPRVQDLVAEGKWLEASGFLRTVSRDFPHIERLFLTDVGGTLMADVPALPGVRGVNFASREWFKGVSGNWQPYVSPVYTRAAAPQINVFAVAVPVKSTAGRIVGILVLQIRVERLLQWVAGIDMGTDAFIYIVDSKGQRAFHSNHHDQKEIIDLSATPIVQKLLHGEQGAEIRNDAVGREEYVVAYSPVSEYGWGVIAQQPTRASLSLQARDESLRQLLVGYGLILLLGAATAIQASRIASGRQKEESDRRVKAGLEQANRALRENEQRLQQLAETLELERSKLAAAFENVEMGLIMSNEQGGDISMNAAATRFLGFSSKEDVYRRVEEYADDWVLRYPDGRVMPYEEWPLPRAIRGDYVSDYEIHFHNLKHDYEWIGNFTSVPVRNSAGKVILIALTILDITKRKHAEEEIVRLNVDLERKVIERTAELQAANRELEAFSYSVSHDLRAPLRSIDGFSQVLLEDYADRLDDQGKNYLNRVRAATQRMGQLIDDMLILSRITRAEMRRGSVDLSALAADVLAELQKSEPERKVDWRIESGLIAEGDAQLLRVALVNLLGNAWKFTGKTATAKIEFGAMRNADGTMEFFVRDNGAGFDMAYADKLFGVFQRLHTLAEFPGTGVGLATVQRIIHRHGGQIRGVGAPDQGATFYFTLTA